MGLQAGVVKRCSIDVIYAPHRRLLDDEELGHFNPVVVAGLRHSGIAGGRTDRLWHLGGLS